MKIRVEIHCIDMDGDYETLDGCVLSAAPGMTCLRWRMRSRSSWSR